MSEKRTHTKINIAKTFSVLDMLKEICSKHVRSDTHVVLRRYAEKDIVAYYMLYWVCSQQIFAKRKMTGNKHYLEFLRVYFSFFFSSFLEHKIRLYLTLFHVEGIAEK